MPEPCFFIVACEPSGDVLGAKIMRALRARLGGKVRFSGVGGERMESEGFHSLFPQSDLALFGVFEVLPKIPMVLRRLEETARAIREQKPSAVITIDGPDFSFRLAKKMKGSGIPFIHDVAPSVWAWRPGRARKIARLYRHLLALLPFEPPYFEKENLGCTFTGHPVIEKIGNEEEAMRLRQRLGLAPQTKILCVLPGSRRSEIKHLAPIFGKVLGRAKNKLGDAVVLVPTVPQVAKYLEPYLQSWPVKSIVLLDENEKYAAFRASHVALAASGTVSLELALAQVPHLVAYKLHWLTGLIYLILIRLKHFNLVNILLKRLEVPEFIQLNCTTDKITKGLLSLWSDEAARAHQRQAFLEVRKLLQVGTALPSEKAAEAICGVAGVC
ncbi:MAG: lipid-A-disaccharide synthase [Proteobacteria bacterium]|nr:lipid-A-disaccharide synthase [Pseudomonadota bacterium]